MGTKFITSVYAAMYVMIIFYWFQFVIQPFLEQWLLMICNLDKMSKSVDLSPIDMGWLSMNPALQYKEACNALKYRKRKCFKKSGIRVPTVLEKMAKRRESSLFENISLAHSCKNVRAYG